VTEDPGLLEQVLASRLEPYADGDRSAVVRIVPSFVSGRRLVHGLGS
jgi:hypothetical protein